ncbi:MAG: hypothetical protein Q9216_004534 [Gyalolechia sp. 2 TL-2023]
MQSLKPPALDKLPAEIQREIYSNLLKADRVRRPPNQSLARRYRFSTAILRVNKRIYQIAYNILYQENRFILVTSDWEVIFGAMIMYRVGCVHAKRNLVKRFGPYVMRLHLACASKNFKHPIHHEAGSDVLQIFIVPQSELPNLVNMLCILDTCYGGFACPFRVTLRVEKPVPGTSDLRFQRKLLEPFRRLTSPSLDVQIFGRVDARYAQGLLDDMMHPICWARAVVWRLYSVMKSTFETAEEALRLGYRDTAIVYYEECQKMWRRANNNNIQLKSVQEDGFRISCAVLFDLCRINIVVLRLRDPDVWIRTQCAESYLVKIEEIFDTNDALASLVNESKIHHYRAIAYAILGRDKDAGRSIRKAIRHNHTSIRHDPQNQILKYHRGIMKRRIAATSEAEKLAIGTLNADGMTPIEAPAPFYLPCDTVANERYLLRRLNYNGDLLPFILESSPADIEGMEPVFARLDWQRRFVTADRINCLWIGSKPYDSHAFFGRARDFSVIPSLV